MFQSPIRAARTARTWLPGRGGKRTQLRPKSTESEAPRIPNPPKTEAVNPNAGTEAKTPAPSSPPSPPTSVSVSSQLLGILVYPGRLYTNSQKRHPLWTQFGTSIVIYFCGDLSSQYVRRPRTTTTPDSTTPEPESSTTFFSTIYDPTRSLRNIIIGGISSLPSYWWFMYLGTLCNYQSMALSLACKVVINQVVFTPMFNSYFFGMQSLLAGLIPSRTPSEETPSGNPADPAATSLLEDPVRALTEAGVRVRDTVPTSWYNSCFFWPFVTAFNYRFVPPRNRNPVAGVVAVGWQTYLGLLNQRAIEKERGFLAGDGVDAVKI